MITVGDVLLPVAEAGGGCLYEPSPTGVEAPPADKSVARFIGCPADKVVAFRVGKEKVRLCRKHLLRLIDHLERLHLRAKIQERGGA